MALEVTRKYDTGIELPAGYFKISSVNLNFDEQTAYIGYQIYKDQAARAANAQPVEAAEIAIYPDKFAAVFSDSKLNTTNANPRATAYPFIKTLPGFENAKDILENQEAKR